MGLRSDNSARRRRRIVSAARTLVLRDGVDGLSMRKLARAAGVSVTTLYNLFGSKAELREALCGDLLDGIDRELERTPLDRPLARARAVISVGVRHVVDQSRITRPALLTSQGGPEAPDLASQRSVAMQTVAIEAAMAAGLLRDDLRADLLAAQVYQGFIAAAREWARGEIGQAGFRNRALYALTVCLLSVATDATRPELVAALQALEPKLARRGRRAA